MLAGLPIGLLHGQLKAADKEGVMAAFRRGELSVLVATTVVEVGVDVAEATVMVIEDAERFGIAQLHQLRGRVGRSDLPSWCYLLSASSTPGGGDAAGGPGEDAPTGSNWPRSISSSAARAPFSGSRQKGRSDLKLASLRRVDRALVTSARQIARVAAGRGPAARGDARARRRAPSLRGRGRSGLPLEELTRSGAVSAVGPQLR